MFLKGLSGMARRSPHQLVRKALRASILQDQGGALAMYFALLVLPLFVITGLAVDGSRALLLRYQFQAALDSAALAVGSTYESAEVLDARAEAFVSRNFRAAGTSIKSVDVVDDGEKVYLTGSFDVETYFMGLVSKPTLNIAASTDVKRAGGGIMVALVLDNTGSMWSSNNIGGLRDSSQTLVDHLFGDETAPPDLRVAIVPYSATINPGAEAETLINPASLPVRSDTDKSLWKGCVVERSGTHSIGDTDVATGGYWTPFMYQPGLDNNFDPAVPNSIIPGGTTNSNGITGYNIGCPTPITPLTNNRQTVNSAVSALTAWNRGGTLTDIGVAWGLRVLSPGAPFTQSTEIDPNTGQSLWESTRWRRAMVIMTDGESGFYNFPGGASPNQAHPSASDDTGYGRMGEGLAQEIFGSSASRQEFNERIEALCTTAKQQGITVYTVVYTSGVGSETRDMYRRCASDAGKYWYAPNKQALNDSFTLIGSDLSRLRIVR
jgi:Flp pilus assembly protein TadG